MTGKQAIKALVELGFKARKGKGDHVILRKEERVIIIANGGGQLSSGMTGKVRSILNNTKEGKI